MHFAHIINPVHAGLNAAFAWEQHLARASMLHARATATGAQVDLFATGFPEDRHIAPAEIRWIEPLTRSVLDIATFHAPRKLPLVADILDRLYRASQAEYFLYTNADIVVTPDFYDVLANEVRQGTDAMAIARHNIAPVGQSTPALSTVHAADGVPDVHGFDGFFFRRDAFAAYYLGTACIGMPRIEWCLITNMAATAERCVLERHSRLLLHAGTPKPWMDARYRDYWVHNHQNLGAIWNIYGEAVLHRDPAIERLLQQKVQESPDFSRFRFMHQTSTDRVAVS